MRRAGAAALPGAGVASAAWTDGTAAAALAPQAKYHLRDVVVGKIYFLMVRIHIKHMEIEIKRRETTGTGGSQHSESETGACACVSGAGACAARACMRERSKCVQALMQPVAPSVRPIVAKYEVMDGEPASRECIPIRLYLSNYDLTPSYGNVLNKFSVRYFLQLVLIDEEDRRYFKQQVRAHGREARGGVARARRVRAARAPVDAS